MKFCYMPEIPRPVECYIIHITFVRNPLLALFSENTFIVAGCIHAFYPMLAVDFTSSIDWMRDATRTLMLSSAF